MSVTFTHLTADPRQEKGEGKIKLPPLSTTLAVPTELEDIGVFEDVESLNVRLQRFNLGGDTEIVLGKNQDGTRHYVKMPRLVAAVVESMKLWQNAKVSASVRPKADKASARDKARFEIVNGFLEDPTAWSDIMAEYRDALKNGGGDAYLDAFAASPE